MMLDSSEKITEGSLKLRVRVHDRRPTSVSAYMVSNDYGAICGGNLRAFIPFDEMNRVAYPTVFRSRNEGNDFINFDIRGKAARMDIKKLYGDK